MVVKLIGDKEVWDNFVDESPHSLLFHKWDFLKIIEKYTSYRLLSYGIYNGDTLICVFPLFFKKSKGLKTVFSPPPQTGVPNLGFVMSQKFDTLKQNKKENSLNIVVDGFNKEMEKISPNYVSISLTPNLLDVRPFEWNNYNANAQFTYIIDLCRPLDEIWGSFKKDIRNEIKQTDSLDLKLLKSDDISMLHEFGKKRYEEQCLNIPVRSKNYLEDLLKMYPKCLELYYLYDDKDCIISSSINIEYKNRYMLWLGGVKPKKKIFGNEYLIWEFIKKAKSEGCKKIDLCGAGVENISHFKSQFNPTLEISFIIHKKDSFGKFAEWSYLKFIKSKVKLHIPHTILIN